MGSYQVLWMHYKRAKTKSEAPTLEIRHPTPLNYLDAKLLQNRFNH